MCLRFIIHVQQLACGLFSVKHRHRHQQSARVQNQASNQVQATMLVGVQELLGEGLPLPGPAAALGEYVGTYEVGDEVIVVTEVEGGLWIAGRGLAGRLVHAGDHRFRIAGVREALTFVFAGPGPAGFLRGPEWVAARAQAPRRK